MLKHLALLPLFTLATALFAQKFQEPSKAELQMTADPAAPGAPAVYLDLRGTTDNRSHYVSEYARIKVLTEAGKEYATVEVPHASDQAMPIIEGRTIHPDGSIVPLAGKAADLLQLKTIRSRRNVSVFNLPDVTVGSILEYKWTVPITGEGAISGFESDMEALAASELAGSIPYWQVQRPIFAHHEYFYFQPFSSLGTANDLGGQSSISYYVDGELATSILYAARLPQGAKVNVGTKGDYFLDLKDVPAYVPEENTPPMRELTYHVGFYYSPYPSPDVYWDNEGKRWLHRLDRFAAASDTLRAAATQLISGADTDEAKARKLYDAVQALDNTDYAPQKNAPERRAFHFIREDRSAQDVWTSRSGSPDEIASLYLALLHAAGLDASPMQVTDRRYRLFDPGTLSMNQFDALLVIVKLNGKDVFTDPGEKFCPFGQLAWQHSLSGGLRATPLGVTHDSYSPAVSAKDSIHAHTADLTVDPAGNITGTLKIVLTGPTALHWRQRNLLADSAQVQKEFEISLQSILPAGISADFDRFQSLDNATVPLAALLHLHGQLAAPTAKRLILPAFPFNTHAPAFVTSTERQNPVDLQYGEQQVDEVTYHLPAGYTVESAPPAAQLPWPEHAALVVKITPADGAITVKRILARAFVLLPAKDYSALRDFTQKVATSDTQQLVLTPPAS